MRRFRFRLAPLLRLRSQMERSSRRELAVALGEVNAVDQRIASATAGIRDCADQARQHGAVGLLAQQLETALRRHEWRLRADKQKAEQRAEAVRIDYVVKARDLKALQKLHEKQLGEWRIAAAKSEQAELDELARLGRAALEEVDEAVDGSNES